MSKQKNRGTLCGSTIAVAALFMISVVTADAAGLAPSGAVYTADEIGSSSISSSRSIWARIEIVWIVCSSTV